MAGEEVVNAGFNFACRTNNIKQAAKGDKFVSGCEVTPNAPADMDVDIAAGVVRIAGVNVTVGAVANETISVADGANDRYDILEVGANGTVDYTAGAPAANPYPPDLAADHVLIAVILVEQSTADITAGDISDSRIIETGAFPLKDVGSDTADSVASSVDETTLCTVTIPANTVNTKIIVTAAVGVEGAENHSDFYLKIGPTSLEATKQTFDLGLNATGGQVICAPMLFSDSTQSWDAEVTVLIRAKNNNNGASHISHCYQLVVTGY